MFSGPNTVPLSNSDRDNNFNNSTRYSYIGRSVVDSGRDRH